MNNVKRLFTSGHSALLLNGALVLLFALPLQTASGNAQKPKREQDRLEQKETHIYNEVTPGIDRALEIREDSRKQAVQLALLLDTSNSMDGLIAQAKSQLWDIVNELAYVRCGDQSRPELQIALYEYGNDNLSSREGYIRQVVGFTEDLDLISEKLFALTTNGGEEFCGEVIHTSLDQLIWNKNDKDLRMIFIAGNEPFDQGKFDFRQAAEEAGRKGVVVNTIFCGAYRTGVETYWKEGATLGGGKYAAINHNDLRAEIATPYDDAIIRLNIELNGTYMGYGDVAAEFQERQMAQDANASSMNTGVAVKRAVAKSSQYYKNSNWDLVDAYEQDEEAVLNMEKEELPEELQKLSKAELRRHIESTKAKRAEIQQEIGQLNVQREQFIKENQQKAEGELENALIVALRDQASSKGFVWIKRD